MSYSESQVDRNLFELFNNDSSTNTLLKISILNGKIRGVSPVEIAFKYPITAIVGENGTGKSTILALISCAFHNDTSFCPQNKARVNAKKPQFYYTYRDFFTFSKSETGISGIEIKSEYHSRTGVKQDIRKKKPSGKWNDFNRRPKRAVSYLGINRIVPPSESNPHRHYCRSFTNASFDEEQLNQLRDSMSHIIGREYSNVELMKFKSYYLFKVKRNNITYTGFNMGAGENAVLGLILEILSAGRGALIVVDEIELGLHTQAQIRLVEELKKLCQKYKCQIICSTHSKEILQHLPPSARVFLKRSDNHDTEIIPNISAEYAFGKLSGMNSHEMNIFVEDETAHSFLMALLSNKIRERVTIIPIGSDQAVLKHMAVHYRENNDSFIAFLDGDKRSQKSSSINKISSHIESRYRKNDCTQFNNFMKVRLNYLPGEEWPEKEVIKGVLKVEDLSELGDIWGGISTNDIKIALETSLTAGKHNEFYEMAKCVSLPREQVVLDLMRCYVKFNPEIKNEIEEAIEAILKV